MAVLFVFASMVILFAGIYIEPVFGIVTEDPPSFVRLRNNDQVVKIGTKLSIQLSTSGEGNAVGIGDRSRSSLRHRLLKAAIENDGTISVTEGVAATDETFEEVEKTLRELVQTGYVDVDNAPDTGVVIYRFTEFRHSDPG